MWFISGNRHRCALADRMNNLTTQLSLWEGMWEPLLCDGSFGDVWPSMCCCVLQLMSVMCYCVLQPMVWWARITWVFASWLASRLGRRPSCVPSPQMWSRCACRPREEEDPSDTQAALVLTAPSQHRKVCVDSGKVHQPDINLICKGKLLKWLLSCLVTRCYSLKY